MLPLTTHLSGLGAANTGLSNAALILGPLFAATPYNGVLHVLQILSFDDLDFGQPRVSQACKWQNHPSVVGRLHFFPFGPGRLYLHGCGFKCWLTCCTIIGFAGCAKPVVTVVVGSSSSWEKPKNPKNVLTLSLDFRNFHTRAAAATRKAPTPNTAPIMSRALAPSLSSSSSTSLSTMINGSSVELQPPALSHEVHARSMSLLQQRPFLHGASMQLLLLVQVSPGVANCAVADV